MKNLLIAVFVILSYLTQAQDANYYNPVYASGLLSFNPSAQTAGFGLIGVVSPTINQGSAVAYNPSLLVQKPGYLNIQVAFTNFLVSSYDPLNCFLQFTLDSLNGFEIAYEYINYGEIALTDIVGNVVGIVNPSEKVFTAAYARKLSPDWSIGLKSSLLVNDICSGMTINGSECKTGYSVGLSLGTSYSHEFELGHNFYARLQWGASINNLGPKIVYSDSLPGEFLPGELLTGILIAPEYRLSKKTRLSLNLAYQAGKYLIPSNPVYATNGEILAGTNPDDVSAFQAIYRSFYDAPYGAKEELSEIRHHVAGELSLVSNNFYYLGIRGGYLYEHPWKEHQNGYYYGVGAGIAGLTLNFAFTDQFWLDYFVSLSFQSSIYDMFHY